jgi:hypothetical protein
VAILQESWSGISPEEGTEDCVCSWCGKMIGRDEADPMWEDHIEYYIGCEVCEIAVRLWRPDRKSLELRFHVKCFNELIVKRNRT